MILEKLVLIMYVEGHASGRTEIKTFEETMKLNNLTVEQLTDLIDSGEIHNGKIYDEAFEIK